MLNQIKLIFKNQKLNNIKRRGISPIITVLLMIGLVVLAGTILFGISNSFLSQQTSVTLNIDGSTAIYKTTETDYRFADELIDEIQIQIENPLEEPVIVDLGQTFLYNASDDSRLSNWAVITDVREIVLNGKESETITFGTVSTNNQGELQEGDNIYVIFKSKLFGSKNTLSSIQSSALTVKLSDSNPLFQALPIISASQSIDTLTFSGDDDEEVTLNLTLAIFNFGNADESYEKTVSITLENTTIFSVANGFETQFVTVPSAVRGGDFGYEGFCEVGEACVNVSFPITKQNLTAVGIGDLGSLDTFGAIISVSGLDFISYKLVLQNPEFKIELENSRLTGVSFNSITFDDDIRSDDTVAFDVRVWNLMDYANNGTFEFFDYNTTVFRFETTGTPSNPVDPNPTSLTFNAGPATLFNVCQSNDGCEEIDWSITRKALVDSNGASLGIEAGTYTAKIRETRTGLVIEIELIIPEYMRPIHVESIDTAKQGNKIDLDITIRDSDGNLVWFAEVTVIWQKPDGSTETVTEVTNTRGVASFTFNNVATGTHTFTVDNVEKQTGWITGTSTLWPYDESANLVTSVSITV
jgi:flagellin-like protein